MNNKELILETIQKITPLKQEWFETAKKRLDNLTKPLGSLGRLEDLAQKICAIQENDHPTSKNKVIFTLASDHGITEEGISAYPQEVTPQMVFNFINQGAAINVLSKTVNAKVVVVDIGVAQEMPELPGLINKKIRKGTSNFAKEPAMSREEAYQSIATGIALVEEEIKNGVDLIGTGEMGIGNTTPSSAITATITDKKVEQVTGQGTGIPQESLNHKIGVIEIALALHKPNAQDPIDVLSKVGGFEIGGMAGIMLGAAKNRIPVVIDGFISGAAALIAHGLCPTVSEYLIPAHRSSEPGHDAVLKHLGLIPLLDLRMRLGEGTGAALGMFLVEASLKIINEMATFEQAHVSEKVEILIK
ncbi:MAG: nicotinate-nucleotide--dimethylbenzimidazole phosphoribosyltransferase [Elusimicrobia bacterium RIFCSPLOWO2_02_FULL_39_32]|nr:MAG: nicotinate-nucleotide--dimethylbenzimidazole phosphoribosyltransferase [Elusimicrobia bacterium GWA2_38_7]OGR79216.1 MAG: nicotinate-nucleotide--dimethylbenzimidazole phosphoribosyltransferase [Elusimicrobia bacterium RIFCSPHIGHO2_02_FULL_39_36]OGR93117.1 MAG: nicotinate-nucleotide--dimethylbenzimidazole phosphoribosyltransferase [Elusimicrobia bacterium RIFCSPLOWO2_02_FULL_39_32]OGR99341.1 MAG: nicotinate-nucleotide--dimethylbenzimidazole phosphoribosyltransferase [Elusimicrobia bacteri